MNWLKKIQRKGLGIPVWTNVYGTTNTEDKYTLIDIGYRANSIASACINLVATSLSEAPLKVYRRQEDAEDIEIPNHWLKRLVDRPNEWMSSFEMWELLTIHLYTGGVAYILLDRQSERGPAERLRLLRPDLVEAVPDENLFIREYRYRPTLPNGQQEEIPYPPWQVLRIALPDPLNEHDGLSPLQRVYRELGIDNKATDFTKQFFENSAVPFGILTTEQDLMEDEAEVIAESWQRRFAGYVKGLFRTAVLGRGAKYEQLGMNFKDMEFEALRSFVETRICAAFKVHPVVVHSWVGIKHSEQRATYEQAKKQFWNESLIPLLRRIESKINSQLLVYEEGVYCRFDLSQIQALQEDQNEKSKRIVGEWKEGLITLDEGRRVLGYEPVQGEFGDKFIFEIIPAKGFGFVPPPNGPGNEPPPGDQQKEQQKGSFFLTKADGEKLASRLLAIQNERIVAMRADLEEMFRKQKKDLNRIISRKAISPDEAAAILQAIQSMRAEWEEDAQQVAEQHFEETADSSADEIAAILGIALLIGLRRDRDQVRIVTVPEVRKFIDEYIKKFAQQITETTIKELVAVVNKAQTEGWAVTKLRDELRAKFNSFIESRAPMIAQTEVTRFSNAVAKALYKQAGFQYMRWVAIIDHKTCPFCRHLNGKIVGIGENFLEKDEVLTVDNGNGRKVSFTADYEAVGHPPIHPHCRCFVVPVNDLRGGL